VSFSAQEVKARFASFAGEKVTIDNTGMMIGDPNVAMLHNHGFDGLSEQPNGLHTGANGGYQVVNLAALAGAKRIPLLGYDMRYHGGKSHSHNGHEIKHPEDSYANYAKHFATMLPQLKKLGVQVINCTTGSAIRCFAMGKIEEVLA